MFKPLSTATLLICAAPLSAVVINVNPSQPAPREVATFTLSGPETITRVSWDFGEGAGAAEGGTVATHVFSAPGIFTVRVRYTTAANSDLWLSAQRVVRVARPLGPDAGFAVSYLSLRWEDGTRDLSVPAGEKGLQAYADLKYEGTGNLQAQWLVDGQVLRSVSQTLTFAGKATLSTGAAPAAGAAASRDSRFNVKDRGMGAAPVELPTNIPGDHTVTLQVTNPPPDFQAPVLHYFVRLAEAPAPPPPLVQSVSPASLPAGQETVLTLAGLNFTEGMVLDLGADVAVLGVPKVNGTGQATVTVFVAPTAKAGSRAPVARRSLKEGAAKAQAGAAQIQITAALAGAAKGSVAGTPKIPPVAKGGGMLARPVSVASDCVPASALKPSKLTIVSPQIENRTDSGGAPAYASILHDSTEFKWTEPNPGAAQFVELSFYDKGGKTRLWTQRVPGNVTHFSVSPAFVKMLREAAAAGKAAPAADPGKSGQDPLHLPQGQGSELTPASVTVPSSIGSISDLVFQIIGYRTYTCSAKSGDGANAGQPLANAQIPSGQRSGIKAAVAAVKANGPIFLAPQGTLQAVPNASALPGNVSAKPPMPAAKDSQILDRVTVVMETTQVAPLALPLDPAGIPSKGACGGGNSKLTLQANRNNYGATIDTATRVGDEVALFGLLDLGERVPYALRGEPYVAFHAGLHLPAPSGVTVTWVEAASSTQSGSDTQIIDPGVTEDAKLTSSPFRFRNVFVDWGDGSVERVVAYPENGNGSVAKVNYNAKDATIGNGLFRLKLGDMVHVYHREDTYPVRVFLSSDEDLQQPGNYASLQAVIGSGNAKQKAFRVMAALLPETSGPKGPKAGVATAQGAASKAAQNAKRSDAGPGQTVLDRSFLLFCNDKTISPVIDPYAAGPLHLVALETQFPGSQGGVAKTTACNHYFSPATRLTYYGLGGKVKVTWTVDGQQPPIESKVVTLGSSAQPGYKPKGGAQPQKLTVEINPPVLPVSPGKHTLTVRATVIADASGDTGDGDAEKASGLAKDGLAYLAANAISPATAGLLTGQSPSHRKAARVGLLNPASQGSSAPVIYFADVLDSQTRERLMDIAKGSGRSHAITFNDYQVDAPPREYVVEASSPGQVCDLSLPTRQDDFTITNLGSGLKTRTQGGKVLSSGQGTLILPLRTGQGVISKFPIPIQIKDWELDKGKVAAGSLDMELKQSVATDFAPGLLSHLTCKTSAQNPGDMLATLAFQPGDGRMTLIGAKGAKATWSASAPLSGAGDWRATGFTMGRSYLGLTPWFFSATGIAIDLSAKEGAGPKGEGPGWLGIHLGEVTLEPDVLGAEGEPWPAGSVPHPKDWSLEMGGVKGTADLGPWSSTYLLGTLAVEKIHFEGRGDGTYSADFKNLSLQSPWFKNKLVADTQWLKAAGHGYELGIESLKAASMPALAGGPMTVEPRNLRLVQIQGKGFALLGAAAITLKAEGKPFVSATVENVGFGFDGRMYFDGKNSQKTVDCVHSTTLGTTPAETLTMTLTGLSQVDEPLNVGVDTRLRISSNPLMPTGATTVKYRMVRGGGPGIYTSPQPANAPFTLAVGFPMGAPTVTFAIQPSYQPDSGAQSGASGNRYSGTVDLSLFGAPPVKAQFLSGNRGGQDYFLVRADMPLSPAGIVIVPEIVSLFRLSGGLGYNFGVDAFADGASIANAQPDMKGKTLFMAGARLGSADHFIYTADGTLTISTEGAARMDFGAWVLNPGAMGQAPLRGSLQYGGGAFDGRIWGGFNVLKGMAALDLGSSEASAALDMHFASNGWHMYAGNRDGQRIKGSLLGMNADAYLMLGNKEGLALGGSCSVSLNVGSSNTASAHASAWLDVGLQVAPGPKFIGDFQAGMELGVCVKGICINGGRTMNIHAEALPLSISASTTIDLPYPLPDVDISVHL